MKPINEQSPMPGNESPWESARKQWTAPTLEHLPKLTDLTLLTGSPIPGTGGTGGTTVF
jgi:hypothetical protein